MNIIPPSFTILDDLDRHSLPVRIEFCGRICYKSEGRITPDSAVPFVEKMAEFGHNSVLEMGVVTLTVSCARLEDISALFLCQPKYLQIDRLSERQLLVTGSIRAFREMWCAFPDDPITASISFFLAGRHPYFYTSLPPAPVAPAGSITVSKMPLAEVDTLLPALFTKHRYLAVKFIVNRAVTHELVRHRPCTFLQESQRYCRYADDKFGNEVTFIKPLFYNEGSPEYELWQQSMAEAEQRYLRLLQTSSPQAARTVLPNSCKTEIIVYTNLLEWRHILALRTPKNAEPSMREVMIPLQQALQQRYPSIF